MSRLGKSVLDDTLEQVEIVYLDRATTKWWNGRRTPNAGEPVAFCGFFWIRSELEGGPFRSRSAAIRDAYYRFVLKIAAPSTGAFADGAKRRNTPTHNFKDWINS